MTSAQGSRSEPWADVANSPGTGWDFSAVRAELGLSPEFPAAALSEVEDSVAGQARPEAHFGALGDRYDATDLPLVTVDPPGSKDLDQAVLIRRRPGSGYRVFYAIADVGAFVQPGGALDAEAWRRGQTLYLPDGNVPLHPPLMSEGAASLLPDQDRLAVLWTVDLDGDGVAAGVDVRRALIRSTAQLDFAGVQQSLAKGDPHPSVALLPEVGRLRRAQAVHRGAIELGVPEQQVEADGSGGGRLVLRPRLLVEEWNAEISLLTGMCAAEMMFDGGVGVLRTVPDPEEETVAALRRSAARLGVDWPEQATPAEALAGLDPARPEALAIHVAGTRLLRGAGYTAFDGEVPVKSGHAGIGARYAHVTAPLRRLVDRYCAEACLAVNAGREIPEWARVQLARLPSAMGVSDRIANHAERACLAQAQAWALRDRVGEVFSATVVRAGSDADGEVFVASPPVIAPCVGTELSAGTRTEVRLVVADPIRREVGFEVA